MFLKNYTSTVPISQTIYRIEQVLIRCGVKGITKDYGLGGKISAITFHVDTPTGKPLTIRLPADEAKAHEALWLDYVGADLSSNGTTASWSSRKRKTKADFADQASRTAWKIIQDWVEVQMSMIELKQADLLQVFLPYVYDGRQTYYQALKDAKFAGLLTYKEEAA